MTPASAANIGKLASCAAAAARRRGEGVAARALSGREMRARTSVSAQEWRSAKTARKQQSDWHQ